MSMRTISVRKFSGAETTNCLKPSQSLLKNPELSLKLPPTADDPLNIAGYPGLQSRHPCCQNMQRLGQELCRLLSWRRRKKNKYPNFSGGVCKRQPLYIQGRWKRAKSSETMSRAQCTTEERKALCKTLHLKRSRSQEFSRLNRVSGSTNSNTHTSEPRSVRKRHHTHITSHPPT